MNNWVIDSLKPIQIAHIDFDSFLAAREAYTTEEWIDFIIQSLGFNPDELTRRNKWFQLIRLVAYCENNYNLIELGPKGTGKSHIFSEFSPHGILVSGGEVTLAKLFVNNSNGKLGLVGFWDVVAFDEFAGAGKRVDKTLVDVMKNYMANKSFSRGTEQLTADASMAFVGNTSKSVSYMLKHTNLFHDLPDKYQDSAFLDRIHFYIPGWEVNIIRNEMFSTGYGFVVDYLAQVFKHLRFHDYSNLYREHFTLSTSLATRDKDGIHKTISGLMKIIYPHRKADRDEMEEVLRFAMEGRKRVKSEIQKIDKTFDPVRFSYTVLASGEEREVHTAEEIRYPKFFRHNLPGQETGTGEPAPADRDPLPAAPDTSAPSHFTIAENQTGISYRKLFGDYLQGAAKIELVDPYIRRTWQVRNLLEFIQVLLAVKEEGEEIDFHLITDNGEMSKTELEQHLDRIQDSLINVDVKFTWEIASGKKLHARHIITDTGWKISLDRGLDIFQRFDGGLFSLESVSQEARYCKGFEITYLRVEGEGTL
jgi:ATP-dependent Lon protease